MPSEGEGVTLIHCYNRGCGKKFDPNENKEESCTFHPGAPFFHDAYKGWSCCKKKCTDFTEFLNIKGCTRSFHNNEKPPEPEKPAVDKTKSHEIVEVNVPQAPIAEARKRPAFDSAMVKIKSEVSQTLVEQMSSLKKPSDDSHIQNKDPLEIPVGTSCKNGGCKQTFSGANATTTSCIYHPGSPVFHEGLKFWTCCQRRTTDFNSFLEQEGCSIGEHIWIKEKENDKQVKCRYDWHQTSSDVVVSVFAKKYDPSRSSVYLNPIRLKIELFFPEEDNVFDLDLELQGIIDTIRSCANMLPTKLEVKLCKAEPGSWPKLNFPHQILTEEEKTLPTSTMEKIEPEVDAVDLSDL